MKFIINIVVYNSFTGKVQNIQGVTENTCNFINQKNNITFFS